MKMVATSDLDTTAKAVGWAIALRIDLATGEAMTSIPMICADASCVPNTAKHRVAVLIEDGWLTRRKRGDGRGHSYRYSLKSPVENPVENLEIKGSSDDPFSNKGVISRTERGHLTNVKGSSGGRNSVTQLSQGLEATPNGSHEPVENMTSAERAAFLDSIGLRRSPRGQRQR